MALYAIAVILVAIEAGDIERLSVSCLQCFQLLLLKPSSKLPSESRKTCAVEAEKTCVLAATQHQMMCSLLKVLVAVQDPALPGKETDLRDHHLGVGVATAHSVVTLKMGVQTLFPKLAHSHVSM